MTISAVYFGQYDIWCNKRQFTSEPILLRKFHPDEYGHVDEYSPSSEGSKNVYIR
jgi:hypothetical protein